jgi:hypothetical protein
VLFVITIFSGPVRRHVPPDRLGHREHVLQVGAPVLSRRGPHRDEDDLRRRHRAGDVGREGQPPVLEVPLHQRLQPRLVDRDLPLVQPPDLPLVDVAADDVVAGLREPGPDHEADVPGAYHCYVHDDCSVLMGLQLLASC